MRRAGRLLGALAAVALLAPAGAQAAFGFAPGGEGFSVSLPADGGAPATQAGSHPYRLAFGIALNEDLSGHPDGDLRDLSLELPAGLILNPSVVPECRAEHFTQPRSSPFAVNLSGESCPDASQVGTIEVTAAGAVTRRFGLFNLAPPPGVAAQLGAAPFGSPLVLDLALRETAEADAFLLRARNISQAQGITAISIELWGTPWGASHDGERGSCLNEAEPGFPWAKCSVGPPVTFEPLAFLTMPTRCGATLGFSVRARSWQGEGEDFRGASHPALGGCASLHFDPVPVGLLTNEKASSPSGFGFALVQLGSENETLTDPSQPAESQARTATVLLPEGVTVNPSVGSGLGTCSRAQFAAESALSAPGAGCPNASKIGSFRVKSMVFEEAFEGSIHLATPHENPFGSLIAVYLVAKLPQRGMMIRLAGRIDPDPASGELTATFDDLPQLPYTDMRLEFRAGQRSFLVTPPRCGAATTTLRLTPWAAPAISPFQAISLSPIETGAGGGPCPPSGPPPFAPGAVAGGVNSNVGSYTPYFIRLSRKDTEQEITSYSLVLPKGISAKLAGIPFCPEEAIAAARAKSGAEETASPSCPAASQVGRTDSGYGVGSALTHAPGRVYLAGPHNGQPLSLVTINAATVGPFDLGTIVIRSAFEIDPRTAQLRIDSSASDPIPHILAGIPLHLREVRIHMDRPEFTHNPSSCEASALVSTLTGSGERFEDPADDSSATVRSHFQLLNCLTLGFKPKLGLRLRGGSRRAQHPSLRATFAARGPQDANLREIAVVMPHSLFLANSHIDEICSKAQFARDACPPGSQYGKAVAHTPLFDEPLRGPVYLRTSDGALPDLVAALRSGEVRINLEGQIGPARHGIRAYFADVPDAPISRFTMTLFGGKRGLLENSQDICADPPLASVKGLGQNNIGTVFTTRLRGQCHQPKKGKPKGRGR